MAIDQKWWQSTIANLGMWTGINGWLETVIPYDEIVKPSNKQAETLAAFKRNPNYQSGFVPETLQTGLNPDRFPPNGAIVNSGSRNPEGEIGSFAVRRTQEADNNRANPLFRGSWRSMNTRSGWQTVLNGWNWWPVIRHSYFPNNHQMYYQGFLANTMAFYTGYYQEWAGGETANFRSDFRNRTKKVIKTLDWKMNNRGEIYPARQTRVNATGVDKPELSQYGDIGVWPQLVWGELPRAESTTQETLFEDLLGRSDLGPLRYYQLDDPKTADRVLVRRTYTDIKESKRLYQYQFETYQQIFGSDATIAEVDWYQWLIRAAGRIVRFIKPAYKQRYLQAMCDWINANHNLTLTTRQIKKIISLQSIDSETGRSQLSSSSAEDWCIAPPASTSPQSMGIANGLSQTDTIPELALAELQTERDLLQSQDLQDWVLETIAAANNTGGGNLFAGIVNTRSRKRMIPDLQFKNNAGELVPVGDFTMQEWQELFWDRMQTGSRPANIQAAVFRKPLDENQNFRNSLTLQSTTKWEQNDIAAVGENSNGDFDKVLLLCSEPLPFEVVGLSNQKRTDRLGTSNLITPNQYGDDAWWASFLGEDGFMRYGDSHNWTSLSQLYSAWPRMRTLAQAETEAIPLWLQVTAEEAWEKVYQGQAITLSVKEANQTLLEAVRSIFALRDDEFFGEETRTIAVPETERYGEEHNSRYILTQLEQDELSQVSGILWTDDVGELNEYYNEVVPQYWRQSDTTFTQTGTISNWPIINSLDSRGRLTRRITGSSQGIDGKDYWVAVVGPSPDAEWQAVIEENQEFFDPEEPLKEYFMFDLPERWNFPVNRNMESRARPKFGFIINWSRILSYRIKTMLAPDN